MVQKYLPIAVILLMLIGTCASVTATTDETNDIWHQILDENEPLGIKWLAYNGTKEDIDITDLSYTTTDTQVIFTMTVAGTIQDSNTIQYGIFVTLSDPNPYNPYADSVVWNAHYTNGFETITDADTSNGGNTTGDAGTNTWTVAFDVDNPDNVTEFYGFAAEYASITDLTSGEYWIDYAPDTAHPSYDSLPSSEDNNDTNETNDNNDTTNETSGETNNTTNNTSGTSTDTPGFELIMALGAIATALIIIRKRK
jgi:hypothetical protein